MLVLPDVRRQPLPDGEQAYLDYRSGVLIVDSDIPDEDVSRFEAEATLCLNGRRDLATYVEPHRPTLQVLPGGAGGAA